MNPNNDCKFIGRLTKDPETRTFDNGGSRTTFSIAVQRTFKNKDGRYDADYIDCQCYNNPNDSSKGIGITIEKFFKKGFPIVICGELRNNNWTGQDGQKHYAMVLNVTDFAFPIKTDNSTVAPAQSAPVSQPMPTQAPPVNNTLPGFDSIPTGSDGYLPFQ